jgi:hypothetical protein
MSLPRPLTDTRSPFAWIRHSAAAVRSGNARRQREVRTIRSLACEPGFLVNRAAHQQLADEVISASEVESPQDKSRLVAKCLLIGLCGEWITVSVAQLDRTSVF